MCLEQIDKSLTAFDFRVYRRVYSSLYVLDDSVVVWFVYFFSLAISKSKNCTIHDASAIRFNCSMLEYV